MQVDPAVGLAVETAGPGVRLVRVTGRLDRAGVAALGRLVDAQRACGRASGHVVVDVGGVTEFDGAAIESLGAVVARSRGGGARVHLAGCGGRAELLPLPARQVLMRCSAFPSAEVAVRALAPEPDPSEIPAPRESSERPREDRRSARRAPAPVDRCPGERTVVRGTARGRVLTPGG